MQSLDQLIYMPENPWVTQVREFNREKLPFLELPKGPVLPTAEDRLYLAGSISQESSELIQALSVGNLEQIIDGALDSIYVNIGILLRCGFNPTAGFEDVHRSNMDKHPAGPGTMGRKTADGRSMKPEGWIPPRIQQLIDRLEALEYCRVSAEIQREIQHNAR